MSALRNTILRGGGRALFKTVPLYTEGAIDIKFTPKLVPLKTAMLGKIDDSWIDNVCEITFTPSGEITTGLIALYESFFAGAIYSGAPVFDPNTDYPMVINTRDGQQLTFNNVALTQPASITCAKGKTLFGPIKFTALRTNGAPWNQASSYYSGPTAVAYPGDAAFNRANIIRQPFNGRWLADRTATLSGTSNANPNVFTTLADHGFLAGDQVTGSGALGDTSGNGTFAIAPTSLTENTFSLYQLGTTTPVAGNGAWTSGGTFLRKGPVPSAVVAGTSNANPDVISTTADHGFLAGDTVTGSGAIGDTAINGTFTVAPTDLAEQAFSLYVLGTTTPVAGNGAWTSGGSFVRANVGDTFGSFDTEDGFSITPKVNLTPIGTDLSGIVDFSIDTIELEIAAMPVGPSVADALAMRTIQGPGAALGQSVAALGIPLYLNGAGVYLKFPLATLLDGGLTFDPIKKRISKVKWSSTMSLTSTNVPVPLMTISTTPIA